jgi:hypothetical protein
VPYQREGEIVLAMWRAVERELATVRPGSPDAEELQAEAARLRAEHQRLTALAVEHHRPTPPAWPEPAGSLGDILLTEDPSPAV